VRHLLAKDLRLVAPYLWLIVPVHALYSFQAFLSPEQYFWLSLAASLAWTVSIAAIEWQYETDRLLASLPVTRATLVRSRYVSALAGLTIGAALFVLYGHAAMALATGPVAERWSGSPSWASADGVTAFLAVGFAAVIGFLPFFFRFGLPLGAMLFSTCAAGAVAATAVPVGAATAHSWSETVRGWLLSLVASWGPWQAGLVLITCAAVLGVLSVQLSVRFYERRDL
jgi:hypothetical protein